MKKFSDYIQESVLAEKDLTKGRFDIEESGDSVIFRYSKGNDMNKFEMTVGAGENVSVKAVANGKEIILNELPRQRFIQKMREFLSKMK
jgi:hypothetical protein